MKPQAETKVVVETTSAHIQVRCKHALETQLQSRQSKQGAKGHRAKFSCGWIQSGEHPASLCNQLGFRAKTKQA